MTGLYSTVRWYRKRAHQLRHEPICRMCNALGVITEATVADHVIPHRHDERLFWSGELQSLCKFHHDSAKKSIENLGYDKAVDVSGNPTDPAHPWNRT